MLRKELRPLHWISREELRHFARKRTPVYMAWDDARNLMAQGGQRGFSLWAFTLGWLAHARYNQEFLELVMSRVNAAHDREIEKLREKYERETGVKLLKGD